jgi:hypothetical protein
MKNLPTTLAWLCLAIGAAGIALGLAGSGQYLLPGAVLTGAAAIAFSLQKR